MTEIQKNSTFADRSPIDGRMRNHHYSAGIRPHNPHRIESVIRSLLLPLPLSGRLLEAVKLLYEIDDILVAVKSGAPDRHTKLKRLNIVQTIAVLECIRVIDALPTLNVDEGAKKRIERAVTKDPLWPTPGHSPGRDALFELYVAASLHESGLQPMFLPEGPSATPDLQAAFNSFPFVVEAKRLTGGQPEKLVRKAARQIKSSGLPGIIALDLTYEVALNSGPDVIRGDGSQYSLQAKDRERFLKFANERAEKITADAGRWVGGNPVFGLMISAQSLFIDGTTGSIWINNYGVHKQLPFGAGTEIAARRHEIGNRMIAARNSISERTLKLTT